VMVRNLNYLVNFSEFIHLPQKLRGMGQEIEPVGHYAVKLIFDDGHATGLYSWAYLYNLGENKNELWKDYLQGLKDAGYQRQEIPD